MSAESYHSNSNNQASSRQTLQELDATQLLANQNPARTATFLPQLQSEAARRLQMQRSRSSEKDNTKSTSDNQPPTKPVNGGDNLSPGDGRSRIGDAQTSRPDSRQTDSKMLLTTSRRGSKRHSIDQESKAKATNPIWRLFKSNKHDDQSERDTESNRPQQRHSQSSSTSSTSMVRNEFNDDDDEYQHHRHFQARASICSNNLWRIGPTRRCSLAVPINSYPTYYRPLAQFQHHRGSGGGGGGSTVNTISGASCLPPIMAHYHIQDEDSELTTTTSSDETIKYRSGTAIERLVNQTTSLVQPKRLFRPDQATRASGNIHEMGPMTSDGFISVGPQMQRGVNAIPPQRSVTPGSCSNSESQMPTPPPPLPPDFVEQSSSLALSGHGLQVYSARGAQRPANRLAAVPAPSGSYQRPNMEFARMIQMEMLDRAAHQDRESSSSATTTILRPEYAAGQLYYSQAYASELAAKQHQLGAGGSAGRPGNEVGSEKMGPIESTHTDSTSLSRQLNARGEIYHNDAYLSVNQLQSMPRSHSTDHRVFRMVRDQASPSNNSALMSGVLQSGQHRTQPSQVFRVANHLQQQQQQSPNYKPLDFMSVQRQQHQSIGRQLGQAYIQRLQRQPAIYSMQHHTRTLQPNSSREAHSFAANERSLRHDRFGQLAGTQTTMRFANEPTIDMLRRSKSQTSLNRRAQGACSLAMDCRHCQMDSFLNKREFAPPTNQLCADSRFAHRPQSETRARVASASHCTLGDCCLRNPTQSHRQPDKGFEHEIGREIGHCPSVGGSSAGAKPIGTTRQNLYAGNEESSCRCSALKESIVTGGSRAQATDQISQLSMLKLINEVDKAIQNAMFIAQHIDNLDEFESVSIL